MSGTVKQTLRSENEVNGKILKNDHSPKITVYKLVQDMQYLNWYKTPHLVLFLVKYCSGH